MPFINDRLEQNALGQHTRGPTPTAVESPEQPAPRLGQSRFVFDPEAVMAHLRSRILGQPEVLSSIADTLKLVKTDIGDSLRPLSVTLLVGATGVGKTETVRVLAEALHGRADAYCRIDMNTLAQDHYSAAITGAPPGYVGSKEGHSLIDEDKVRGSFSRPGIVLLDEVEKAGPEVLRALLNVLDRGQLRLTSGNKSIDFCNAMIFMTSNLGARALAREQKRWARGWRRWMPRGAEIRQRNSRALVDAAIERAFDPEFINRIDQVLLYRPLDADWLAGLVSIALQRLNQRLAGKGWHLVLDGEVFEYLQRETYDPRFGARSIARGFRSHVEAALAEYLLQPAPQFESPSSLGEQRRLRARLSAGRIHISER